MALETCIYLAFFSCAIVFRLKLANEKSALIELTFVCFVQVHVGCKVY